MTAAKFKLTKHQAVTGSRDRTVKEWDLGRAYCEAQPPAPCPHPPHPPGWSVRDPELLWECFQDAEAFGVTPPETPLPPPTGAVTVSWWPWALGWEAGDPGSSLGRLLGFSFSHACGLAPNNAPLRLGFCSLSLGSRTINVLSYCNDVVCGDHVIISGHNDQKIRFWDSR